MQRALNAASALSKAAPIMTSADRLLPPPSFIFPAFAAVRKLAEEEGRQLQALVDEALADLIEKRKHGKPRQHVMASYLASHEKYGELYKKLAK